MTQANRKPKRKAKFRRVGWAGFCDDRLYFQMTTDTYSKAAMADIYKSRREARKRFQDVREVFVRGPR
jgi:hypothetical protein